MMFGLLMAVRAPLILLAACFNTGDGSFLVETLQLLWPVAIPNNCLVICFLQPPSPFENDNFSQLLYHISPSKGFQPPSYHTQSRPPKPSASKRFCGPRRFGTRAVWTSRNGTWPMMCSKASMPWPGSGKGWCLVVLLIQKNNEIQLLGWWS